MIIPVVFVNIMRQRLSINVGGKLILFLDRF